jgi:hypothetical protein
LLGAFACKKKSISQCKYHSIIIGAESLRPFITFESSVQADFLNPTWSFLVEDTPPE